LSGKLLSVITTRLDAPECPRILVEFPTLENRLGQVFLTGRCAILNRGEWSSNRQVAIAWSAIVSYIVFESRDDYQQRGIAARRALGEIK
jgi:hypothetical protein